MNTASRISTLLVALSMPLMALAAPANVTGIKAEVTQGGVQVSWNPVGGEIAMYRVFYSQASILNNNGLYDDFETASGNATSHILANLPPVSDLYVSVLAVDTKGNESPFFLEEAHVTLGAVQPPQAQPPVPTPVSVPTPMPTPTPTLTPTSQPTADILRFLSINVDSSTGVTLHFSLPVNVDPNRAVDAVTIETASGTKLAMKRFVIQGNDLTIHTDVQERGTAYKVTVTNAITAAGSSGQRLAVVPGEDSLFFVGHPTGRDPTVSSIPSSTTPIVKSDITQLRLRAQPEGKSYRVDATWQAPAGDFTGYAVSQTTDGGKTYGTAKAVAKNTTSITVKNVPSGSFGMVIRTVYADGTQSKGIMQTITLAPLGGVTGSVVGGSGKLPNSGPALWLAVIAAGTGAYMFQKRSPKNAEAVA